MKHTVYLIELTDHKREDLYYYPFIIWQCFGRSLKSVTSHIETCYGKIKAVWKCDSLTDAKNWREYILELRR